MNEDAAEGPIAGSGSGTLSIRVHHPSKSPTQSFSSASSPPQSTTSPSSPVTSTSSSSTPNSSGRLTISVLSYNLNLLPKGVNPVGHRYKSARLAEFTSKCLGEYDVMALQEVFSTPYLPAGFGCRQAQIVALAARHGYSAVRGRQPSLADMLTLNRTTDSGLLILSKYPVLKSGSYTFTHRGAHMDAGASKGVIFALIKVGHANVLVFNTHLQATHSSSSHRAAAAGGHGRGGANYESIRYRQILELKNFINKQRHVNGRDVPWLLTGDFNIDAISRPAVADEYGYVYDNTSIESEEYKKLVSLLDPAGRMRDLLKECNNGEHPATRPPRLEFPSSVDLVFKHKYPQRLDYIFWSSPEGETALTVPKSRLDHTKVVPFVVTGMEFSHLSDHYGIETTLEYRGIKDDEDAILFSTEKAFSDIFNDKQAPAPSKWFTKGWKVLALVAASVWILTWIYPHCPLEVFVQVALFMGAYLVYKLYKLIDKLLRKKPFKHDIEPGQQVMKSIIGKYDVARKEGPLHRSPHSPHRLLDLADGASTLYDNFSDGSRGPYAWLTYDEVWTRVSHFGSGLLNLGYQKGDLVGIFSENRVEWVVTEQACNAYSLVCVPVYDAGDGCLQYILNHARLTVLLDMSAACPDLRVIIQMEPIEYEESYAADQCNIRLIPYNFVEKDGLRRPQPHVPPEADDLATLAYDMSTQGKIKGVMLSHRNLLSSSRALGRSRLTLTCEDVHISYIPLHMRIERSVLALLFSVGASLGFSQEDGSKIFDDIQVLRPTLLFGVPGMFIRLYRKCKVIVSSWWGPRQALFHYAYKRKQRAHRKRRDTPFWNNVLFRKFAARLGGRVRLISILSDGLLPLVHKEFLQICFCCWVTESYWKGTVGVVTGSSMYSFAEDEQAGYPLPCNEIKLVDIPQQGFSSRGTPERGRIKIRGHNVFVGYYGDTKLTDAKIDAEGWLTTNDIGQWNPNGTLTVLGHEQGILQPVKGQIVFNKYLEYLYLESYFVQQIFVTCLPFRPLVAVVVPDHEVLCWWAKENNLQHDFRPETLCRDPRVREAVLKDLEAVADQHKSLSAWEYVKAVHLEPSFFNVENQCITPTFTLRRQHLRTRFSEQIMEMYRELSADIHDDIAHHHHHHHLGANDGASGDSSSAGGGGARDGDSGDEKPMPPLRSSQLTLPTYTDTKRTPYLPAYQSLASGGPALDPLRHASPDRDRSGIIGGAAAAAGVSVDTNGLVVLAADGSAPSTLAYCVCGDGDATTGAIGARPLRSSTHPHPRGHHRTPSLTVVSSSPTSSSSSSSSAPPPPSSSSSTQLRRSHAGMPSSLSSPSLSSLDVAGDVRYCAVCRRRLRPRSLSSSYVPTPPAGGLSSSTADDDDDRGGEREAADQLLVGGGTTGLLLPINSDRIDDDSDDNSENEDDDDADAEFDDDNGNASDTEVVRTLC